MMRIPDQKADGTFPIRGIIVQHDRLSHKALQGLIEEFVTRDGTDTGHWWQFRGKVEMVIRQLKRGDVFIVYDEATQTANIVPRENAKSNSQEDVWSSIQILTGDLDPSHVAPE